MVPGTLLPLAASFSKTPHFRCSGCENERKARYFDVYHSWSRFLPNAVKKSNNFYQLCIFFSGYLRRAHVRIIPRWRLGMREEGDGITARILDVLAPLS